MKIIFTCLFFSAVLFASAQNTFKVRAFEDGESLIYQMAQLNDGSLVSVGDNVYFDSTINDYRDVMIILKTSTSGTVLASKAIKSIAKNSAAFSVTKTSDGGFAVFGTTSDSLALLKFTASLGMQWQKKYALRNESDILKVLQTTDGGYLIAGDIYNYELDQTTAYIGKTDAQGNLISLNQYFGYTKNNYTVKNITSTNDGNYVFLAESNSNDDTTFLVKIKPDLSTVWSRKFNINKDNFLQVLSLMEASDGSIVIAGNTYNRNSDQIHQLMAIKCNSSGIPLWSKLIQPDNNKKVYSDAASSLEDKSGNYVFVDQLELYDDEFNKDTSYAYAVKITPAGTLEWTRTFERNTQNGFTEFSDIIQTADGGYVTCGDGEIIATDNPETNFSNDFSFVYGFDSNFQTCGEVAGSNGTLQSFDVVSDTARIPTTAITAITSTATFELSNIGNITYLCNTLPLRLLSFNATLQNKSVAVQWTTANEINTSYFEVEKSKDAIAFKPMQKITAKGNNTNVQAYSITDLQPLPGTSYYRLKEIDKDGKITYSSVVPVTMLNNGSVIISPNPVQNEIRIVVQSSGNASLILQVIDVKGNLLTTKKASLSTGRNEITIPAASLAKGVYVVKIIQNSSAQTIRFVKE